MGDFEIVEEVEVSGPSPQIFVKQENDSIEEKSPSISRVRKKLKTEAEVSEPSPEIFVKHENDSIEENSPSISRERKKIKTETEAEGSVSFPQISIKQEKDTIAENSPLISWDRREIKTEFEFGECLPEISVKQEKGFPKEDILSIPRSTESNHSYSCVKIEAELDIALDPHGPAHIEPSSCTAPAQPTHYPHHGMGRVPQVEPSCCDPAFTMSALELLLDLESESEREELVVLYSLVNRKRKKKSNYLAARNTYGEFNLFKEVPDGGFKNSFQLRREQFFELHELIKIDITGRECNAMKPIGSEEKLAVCLRYLATGDMFKTIALSYRMGERTVSKIVSDVCDAIWLRLQPIYMPEPTVEMWETIAMDFERKLQFYNCVGAIGGKLISVRKPLDNGSFIYKRKQYFSVVLMVAVDAHYRFITVDVGSMDRFSDGNMFSSSSLGQKLKNGSLHLPQPKPLPQQNKGTPFVFIGDNAFSLMPNLMRPYPKVKVTGNFENKVFNDRLSRACQSVECAFRILSARFRVFKRPFECKLETIDKVVLATIVLHNYLRSKTLLGRNPNEEDDELAGLSVETNFAHLPQNRTRSSRTAFLIREQFKDCFSRNVNTEELKEGNTD